MVIDRGSGIDVLHGYPAGSRFELLDAAGRLLLNGSLTDPSTYVPLPGIGEGIYLLRITNAERVESIRFLHR